MSYDKVIQFWFHELNSKQWFKKDQELDQTIKQRFNKTHTQAIRCELYSWRKNAEGRLAEIIVIDQFSRNMFRNQAESFIYDPLALCLAQEAVHIGADKTLDTKQKSFLYMPYMHSESLVIHEQAIRLFSQPGLEYNLEYELQHKAIIDRFGRYPHRNKILGRPSTPEELEFLKEPNSGF